MNPRLTAKDRGLIKGAVRRAFSRSALHKAVMDRAITDDCPAEIKQQRPRVKTWRKCEQCKKYCAAHEMQVDHIDPAVPIHKTFEGMTLDEFVDRTWCAMSNLQAICLEPCHTQKSSQERKLRKEYKNGTRKKR